MEIYESFVWIAIGFIPTLLTMEIAYRATSRFRLAGRKKIAVIGEMMGEVTKP
jgi:hypothetical protein